MVIAKLKSRTVVPHGGMFILDLPEKGMVGKGTTFKMLVRKIKDWRHANAVVVGLDFENEVEREVCLKYEAECESNDPRIPSSEIRLTLDDIVAGTKMIGALKRAGTPLVSDEEANRRAAICAQCSFQSSFTKPCGGICQVLKDAVTAIIGTKKTQYDSRLRACRICKCFNAAAVFVPLEYQTDYLTEEQKMQFAYAKETNNCWKSV